MGMGWVRVEPPTGGSFIRDGWIQDLDVATLTAIDARRSFVRVEVLDADGEVRVTVDRSGASAPHRAPEKIPASALPFLAAAMRVELREMAPDHKRSEGEDRRGLVQDPKDADPGERPEFQRVRAASDAGSVVEARGAGAALAAPLGDCPKGVTSASGAEKGRFVSGTREAPQHEPKRCPRCPASIFWAQVLDENDQRVFVRDQRSGQRRVKAIPVDFEPTTLGKVVLFHRAGEGIVCRVLRRGEAPPSGGKLRTFPRCSSRVSGDANGVQVLGPAAQVSRSRSGADVGASSSGRGGGR